MTRDELLIRLNRFYYLELFQVDLYVRQSKTVQDILVATALERFAAIEQQHVDNIGSKIKELGGQPNRLTEFVAPIAGRFFGQATKMPGLVAMYKANIGLEESAMAHYRQLILKVADDQELYKMLWYNMIDEDEHKVWFQGQLEKISP